MVDLPRQPAVDWVRNSFHGDYPSRRLRAAVQFSGTRQSHMAFRLNWMEVFIPEIIKLNGIVQQAMFDYPEYMFIEATNND